MSGDPHSARDVTEGLCATFAWRTDRAEHSACADVTGWWREPALLASLGRALGSLHSEAPTVVLGPQSRGSLLGALVAAHFGVGLVEARKDPGPASDSDQWRTRTTPPDYKDRHIAFGFRRDLIRSGDRVLFVDDWIDTGATAVACKSLVLDSGARWTGAATVVDALNSSRLRLELSLRSLLHLRDLPPIRDPW